MMKTHKIKCTTWKRIKSKLLFFLLLTMKWQRILSYEKNCNCTVYVGSFCQRHAYLLNDAEDTKLMPFLKKSTITHLRHKNKVVKLIGRNRQCILIHVLNDSISLSLFCFFSQLFMPSYLIIYSQFIHSSTKGKQNVINDLAQK